MKKKIVYVIGGLYRLDGMTKVLSQKVNYLAEHTDFEIYVILTERAEVPFSYAMSPKIKFINFNLNFDELDTMPLLKKVFHYQKKTHLYKKLFSQYLMIVRPDITVSAMRREINFLTSIPDGSKKVGEIHFNKGNYRQFNKKYLPSFINRFISKWWMRNLVAHIKLLDKFVVLSYEDREAWHELQNPEVIHNPLTYFPDKTSDCLSHKVIAVGRYTWQKGFDFLLEAWSIVAKAHPNWELHIYGSGERKEYQLLAERKGIANSVFCEEATNDIYNKFCESSIFVLSSRYEGFGMVITEAMACGVPPVSFACPCGPKDIIRSEEDGILVENENIDQLAEKICYLIENENKRKEMGKEARENVKRFKEEKIMPQWIELFNNLLREK